MHASMMQRAKPEAPVPADQRPTATHSEATSPIAPVCSLLQQIAAGSRTVAETE